MNEHKKQTVGETLVTSSPDIWTTDEVAEYLRISPDMVRLEARKGRLPGAFQIGTLWRFHAQEVRRIGKERAAA